MKILAVDNDKRLANIMKDVFENCGFEVELANSGEDALNKINFQKNFELLITDIKIPKKNGLELVKDLRSSGNKIPIIFFTGNSNLFIKEKSLELGVNEYIIKPTDFSVVIDIIKKYEK